MKKILIQKMYYYCCCCWLSWFVLLTFFTTLATTITISSEAAIVYNNENRNNHMMLTTTTTTTTTKNATYNPLWWQHTFKIIHWENVSCREVINIVELEDKCNFVRNARDCNDDGMVNFLDIAYCHIGYTWLSTLVFILVLAFLFLSIGSIADDFLCPQLVTISRSLKLSPNIAGVTFLAFGNGAPDIFSSIIGITAADPSMVIGQLYGAGIFVTTIVVGSIMLQSQFQIMHRPLLRDISFYVATTTVVWVTFMTGRITLWHAFAFIIIYIIYVIVVVVSGWIFRRQRSKKLSQSKDCVKISSASYSLDNENYDNCCYAADSDQYMYYMQRSVMPAENCKSKSKYRLRDKSMIGGGGGGSVSNHIIAGTIMPSPSVSTSSKLSIKKLFTPNQHKPQDDFDGVVLRRIKFRKYPHELSSLLFPSSTPSSSTPLPPPLPIMDQEWSSNGDDGTKKRFYSLYNNRWSLNGVSNVGGAAEIVETPPCVAKRVLPPYQPPTDGGGGTTTKPTSNQFYYKNLNIYAGNANPKSSSLDINHNSIVVPKIEIDSTAAAAAVEQVSTSSSSSLSRSSDDTLFSSSSSVDDEASTATTNTTTTNVSSSLATNSTGVIDSSIANQSSSSSSSMDHPQQLEPIFDTELYMTRERRLTISDPSFPAPHLLASIYGDEWKKRIKQLKSNENNNNNNSKKSFLSSTSKKMTKAMMMKKKNKKNYDGSSGVIYSLPSSSSSLSPVAENLSSPPSSLPLLLSPSSLPTTLTSQPQQTMSDSHFVTSTTPTSNPIFVNSLQPNNSATNTTEATTPATTSLSSSSSSSSTTSSLIQKWKNFNWSKLTLMLGFYLEQMYNDSMKQKTNDEEDKSNGGSGDGDRMQNKFDPNHNDTNQIKIRIPVDDNNNNNNNNMNNIESSIIATKCTLNPLEKFVHNEKQVDTNNNDNVANLKQPKNDDNNNDSGQQQQQQQNCCCSISPFEILLSLAHIELDSFQKANFFTKTLQLIKAPIYIIFTLTIAVVDTELPLNGWCKPLNLVHILLSPQSVLLLTELSIGCPNRLYTSLIVASISLFILIPLVMYTSERDTIPSYHVAFAYFGFVVAICWIYKIANEVVNLIKSIGILYNLSQFILGLTFLAWGNSIGDFISNMSMARNGFPRMAISACFGGPVLNMLLGIGIPYAYRLIQVDTSIQLQYNPMISILYTTITTSLLSTIVILVFWTKFSSSSAHGLWLYGVYAMFLAAAIYTESMNTELVQ